MTKRVAAAPRFQLSFDTAKQFRHLSPESKDRVFQAFFLWLEEARKRGADLDSLCPPDMDLTDQEADCLDSMTENAADGFAGYWSRCKTDAPVSAGKEEKERKDGINRTKDLPPHPSEEGADGGEEEGDRAAAEKTPAADDSARKSRFPGRQDPFVRTVEETLNGLTDTHRLALNGYRKTLGDGLVGYAVDSAVAHGSRNWAYVERVLENLKRDGVKSPEEARAISGRRRELPYGGPLSPAGIKTVSAQRYAQREYDEKQLEEALGVNDLFRERADPSFMQKAHS